MKRFSILILTQIFGSIAFAALPPQFSECLRDNTSSAMNATDLSAIAKISKITYCQNQVGLVTKADTMTILRNPNVNMAISLSKTTYTIEDLNDIATSGSYLLYVDGSRLSLANLQTLSRAGVQLVVMSSTAGLSKGDLMTLAQERPFILNVNSPLLKADLRDYVTAGIQIVIRTNQAGLTGADILEVAQLSSDRVTVLP